MISFGFNFFDFVILQNNLLSKKLFQYKITFGDLEISFLGK